MRDGKRHGGDHGLGYHSGPPYIVGNNLWVAIKCESAEETEKLFAAFSENGKVVMPVGETFWAVRLGC